MAIGKCVSVVLSVTPYRESSILTALFSLHYGRINAIAKGIRKVDRRRVPIERGYTIEHLVYIKTHGDLHQITDCSIQDFFPRLRGDLEKTAVRDLFFDMVLSAVPVSDPHPELYDFLIEFLAVLDGLHTGLGGYLMYGARTLFGFAAHLGFSLDFGKCTACGGTTAAGSPAWLDIEHGIVRCDACSLRGSRSTDRRVPGSAVQWFAGAVAPSAGGYDSFTDKDAQAAVRLAYDYCRYHLDIRRRLDSFGFIEHLAGMRP